MYDESSFLPGEEKEEPISVPLIVSQLVSRLTEGLSEALKSTAQQIALPPAEEGAKPSYLTEAQWVKLYKNRQIDERELEKAILTFYKDTTQGRAVVQQIIIDTYGWISDALFKKAIKMAESFEIGIEELVEICEEMGIPDRYIRQLVKLVLLNQISTKELTKTDIMDIWVQGVFSEEEARVRLQRLGYSTQDINAMIEAVKVKKKM